jgi:hypothetical protein
MWLIGSTATWGLWPSSSTWSKAFIRAPQSGEELCDVVQAVLHIFEASSKLFLLALEPLQLSHSPLHRWVRESLLKPRISENVAKPFESRWNLIEAIKVSETRVVEPTRTLKGFEIGIVPGLRLVATTHSNDLIEFPHSILHFFFDDSSVRSKLPEKLFPLACHEFFLAQYVMELPEELVRRFVARHCDAMPLLLEFAASELESEKLTEVLFEGGDLLDFCQ